MGSGRLRRLFFAVSLFFQWKGERRIEGIEAILATKHCPICAVEFGPTVACQARFGPDYDENSSEEPTDVWRVKCSKCGAESDFDKAEQRLHVRTGAQPEEVE